MPNEERKPLLKNADEVTGILPEVSNEDGMLLTKEEKEVLDFAYKVARQFDKSRDSHVYFYLQQAFPENEDWEWGQFQDLLNRVIKNAQAQLDADRNSGERGN